VTGLLCSMRSLRIIMDDQRKPYAFISESLRGQRNVQASAGIVTRISFRWYGNNPDLNFHLKKL
jgi:hypothetical protein